MPNTINSVKITPPNARLLRHRREVLGKTKDLREVYNEYLEYVKHKKTLFEVFINEDILNNYVRDTLKGVSCSLITNVMTSYELYLKRVEDHAKDKNGVINDDIVNIINEYYVNYGYIFKHDVDFSMVDNENLPFEIADYAKVFKLAVCWDNDKKSWYSMSEHGDSIVRDEYEYQPPTGAVSFLAHEALARIAFVIFHGKNIILRTRDGDVTLPLGKTWKGAKKKLEGYLTPNLIGAISFSGYQLIVPTHESNFYLDSGSYIYGYKWITNEIINKYKDTFQYGEQLKLSNVFKAHIGMPESWIYEEQSE